MGELFNGECMFFLNKEPIFPIVDTSNCISTNGLENVDGKYIGIDDFTTNIPTASISFEIKADAGTIKALFTPTKAPKLPRKIKKLVKKHYIVDCPTKIGKWPLAVAWSFNTKKKKWLNGISFTLTNSQE